jgi:putative peptidoglycan lipid II flippase
VALRDRLLVGVRQTLFLTLPAAIGLFLLAEPIVASIFQYGRFSSESTALTALALKGYTLGLVSYACMKVIAPAFSAIDRPEIPLRVSLTGIFLNLTFNYILIRVYNLGILGLTLTTASVATLNILQLVWASQRHVGSYFESHFLQGVGKILLCCVTLIGALLLGLQFIHPMDQPIPVRIGGTFALVLLGSLAYFLVAKLLKLPDLGLLLRTKKP